MFKSLIFVLILFNYIYFSVSLSLLNSNDECIIYISTQGNNNITCGANVNSTCISLDSGLVSCQDQGLTSKMSFYFDNGIYYLENNQTINFYNQSIGLYGCSSSNCSTTFNFSNMDSNIFQVIEPNTSLTSDHTTLVFSQIYFEDLTKANVNQPIVSFLQVIVSVSLLNINILNCSFNTFTTSQYGSVLNLNVDDQSLKGRLPQYVELQVTDSIFTSNSASKNSGVMYAKYMVNSNFNGCVFRNNQANTTGVISSLFGSTNFTNCIFEKNDVNYLSLVTLSDQPIGNFFNCSFIDNGIGYIGTSSDSTLIRAMNAMLGVYGTTFIRNEVMCVLLRFVFFPSATIGSSSFINNTANVLIQADYKSNVIMKDLVFENNKQPDSPFANSGFINVQSAANVSIQTVSFIDNIGTNIFTNDTYEISISDISTANNSNYAFLVCLNSTLSIYGNNVIQNNNTAYSHPIQCQASCDIESTLQSQMCPNKSNSTTKPNSLTPAKITFIFLGSILGFVLLIGAIILIRKRLKKHHYNRIG